MALHGKFYLNKADFAPLVFPGVGTFMAYSGNKGYRNQPGCTFVTDNGPLPVGRYWIVDRHVGGMRTQFRESLATLFRRNIRADWFGLYRDDGSVNDYTWIDGIKRGSFRLHPAGSRQLSLGCLSVHHPTDFYMLREALLRTPKIQIPGAELSAHGTIEVIGDESLCPVYG